MGEEVRNMVRISGKDPAVLGKMLDALDFGKAGTAFGKLAGMTFGKLVPSPPEYADAAPCDPEDRRKWREANWGSRSDAYDASMLPNGNIAFSVLGLPPREFMAAFAAAFPGACVYHAWSSFDLDGDGGFDQYGKGSRICGDAWKGGTKQAFEAHFDVFASKAEEYGYAFDPIVGNYRPRNLMKAWSVPKANESGTVISRNGRPVAVTSKLERKGPRLLMIPVLLGRRSTHHL